MVAHTPDLSTDGGGPTAQQRRPCNCAVGRAWFPGMGSEPACVTIRPRDSGIPTSDRLWQANAPSCPGEHRSVAGTGS